MHSNKNIPTFQDVVLFSYNSLISQRPEGGKLWRAKTKPLVVRLDELFLTSKLQHVSFSELAQNDEPIKYDFNRYFRMFTGHLF